MATYLINTNFSAPDLADIQSKLGEIDDILDFTIQLTPTERMELPSVSDRREPFLRKAIYYANQHPDVFPDYIGINHGNMLFNVYDMLTKLKRDLKQLLEKVDDTGLKAGAEAFSSLSIFYGNVGVAKENGQPGLDTVYDDLRKLYPSRLNPVVDDVVDNGPVDPPPSPPAQDLNDPRGPEPAA